MRKQSREMPAEWALTEVLDKAPYITVSMVTPEGEPYATPLSLARTDERTFYFHSAPEGKKNEVWKSHPTVWLSAVSKCKPTVGPKNGSFTLVEPPVGKRKQYDAAGDEMKYGRME